MVTTGDILGCWELVGAFEDRDGVIGLNPFLGENPKGFLHYLADNRVAVTVGLAGRKPYSTANRRLAPIEELAESARTFDAYAGTFRFLGPDTIAHNIEVSTDHGDVGTDLVRRIAVEDDILSLQPILPEDIPPRWLEWRRLV